MQNLAILTNGGDTCALNASIEAIRRESRKVGFGKIIGIEGGYHGLLHRNFRILAERVDEHMGGTVLRSLRDSPCRAESGRYIIDENKVHEMVEFLEELEVDLLVVIGGDGTLQATKLFHLAVQDKYRFKIMGFPKTIDNDIRTKTTFEGIEVALCPGFPTAARKIAQVTEDIRTTAISAQRVFGIEAMGRDAGWLAAAGRRACLAGGVASRALGRRAIAGYDHAGLGDRGGEHGPRQRQCAESGRRCGRALPAGLPRALGPAFYSAGAGDFGLVCDPAVPV